MNANRGKSGLLLLAIALSTGCGKDSSSGDGTAAAPTVSGSVEATSPKKSETRRVYGYAWKSELLSAGMKKDLDRGLLTDVAIAFAKVDSKGNITGFDPTSSTVKQFVDLAHGKGVSVHLAVALFGSETTKTVLVNAQQKMVNQIVSLLEAADLDAASLDFEAVPHTAYYRDLYSDFTEKLRDALWPKGLKLYHAVSQRPESNMDPVRLSNASDGLFIMGYAYAGSWSTYAAPNAPYSTGGLWNRSYESDMLNPANGKSWKAKAPDPKKLILGVPFYGHRFQVQNGGIKAHRVAGSSVPAITVKSAASSYGTKWDSASKSPYWEWTSGGVKYQAWFENAQSMAIKFQGVKDAGFGGIGMWKLPWGTEEIWDEIQKYKDE